MTFTDIASKCPADDIVNMLNDMYHRFDTHADFYDVYKVPVVCRVLASTMQTLVVFPASVFSPANLSAVYPL